MKFYISPHHKYIDYAMLAFGLLGVVSALVFNLTFWEDGIMWLMWAGLVLYLSLILLIYLIIRPVLGYCIFDDDRITMYSPWKKELVSVDLKLPVYYEIRKIQDGNTKHKEFIIISNEEFETRTDFDDIIHVGKRVFLGKTQIIMPYDEESSKLCPLRSWISIKKVPHNIHKYDEGGRSFESNALEFINYRYIPFSKSDYIARLLVILIAGLGFGMAFESAAAWRILSAIISVFAAFMILLFMFRKTDLQINSFLCQGVFSVYISLMLVFAAYKVLSTEAPKPLLLVLMLASMLVVTLLYVGIALRDIRKGVYNIEQRADKLTFLVVALIVFGWAYIEIVCAGKSELYIKLFGCALFGFSLIAIVYALALMKAIILIREKQFKL